VRYTSNVSLSRFQSIELFGFSKDKQFVFVYIGEVSHTGSLSKAKLQVEMKEKVIKGVS
jgi:hypothetical protein